MSDSTSDSEDDSFSDEEDEEFREDMRVFLRLRPMNKLETSRRSKNCCELHEDPTVITVDSPLEGEYDFFFHHVFEEDATQEEVYTNALAEIPEKLMAGFNCTVIAYGQTGSGKTHTMMGANGASEGMLQHAKRMKAAAAANDPSIHSLQDGSSVSQSVAESLDGEQKVDGPIDPEDEGMIARTVAHLFDEMKKATPTTEFVVRCSYIEIYLEKVLDLLHPQGGESVSLTVENESDSAAGVGDNKVPNVRIAGAAELCCFDVSDVCALLARGNACRTMSATEMNTDSSRSHAIFVMRIEQIDRATNRTTFATLHMIDLAGSELAANSGGGPRANTSSALQIEAKMINKSLTALQKMVQAQVENQRGAEIKLNATSRLSKLTRLLRPSFGGNCLTTIILTASPSSYNIGETISSIRFGQRCRKVMNQPAENTDVSAKIYRDKLAECEQKNTDALALIRTLAKKCQTLQVNSDVPATGPLWEMIESITAEDGGQPVDLTVSVRRRKDNGSSPFFEQNISTAPSGHSEKLHDRIEALEEELAMTAKARDDAENAVAELQSEVIVLRTQNENLTADKKRTVTDLMETKNEVQMLSQRKLEVEHNLRTSQFRENEAIVFLRQFRRFYTNVLKDKAAHGAGSVKGITTEITLKVPNAPDLNQLRDIDEMLLESGLLEEHELGEDRSSTAYRPTKDSLMRSAAAAARASKVEHDLNASGSNLSVEEVGMVTGTSVGSIRNVTAGVSQLAAISEIDGGASVSDINMDSSMGELQEIEAAAAGGADAGAGVSEVFDSSNHAHSIARPPGTGMVVTRQQKVLRTPSGRLTMLREKTVEKELFEMSERCIDLQIALNEEKAIVDALTNKAGGITKKKIAQEAISLRQQLEKKTASLTAIAWKMNELNLINKTFNEKMVNREQHVLYLEETMLSLMMNNNRVTGERQENEKKMREEIEQLSKVVQGMTMPLWQFGEAKIDSLNLAARMVIPIGRSPENVSAEDFTAQRRKSNESLEPDVDQGFDQSMAAAVSKSRVHVSRAETKTISTQTDGELTIEKDGVKNVETSEMSIQTDDVMTEVQNLAIAGRAAAPNGFSPTDPFDAQVASALPEDFGVHSTGIQNSQEETESGPEESDDDADSEPGPASTQRAVPAPMGNAADKESDAESDESAERNAILAKAVAISPAVQCDDSDKHSETSESDAGYSLTLTPSRAVKGQLIDEEDSGDDGSESYTDPRQSHRVPLEEQDDDEEKDDEEEQDDSEDDEPARPLRAEAGRLVNEEESDDEERDFGIEPELVAHAKVSEIDSSVDEESDAESDESAERNAILAVVGGGVAGAAAAVAISPAAQVDDSDVHSETSESDAGYSDILKPRAVEGHLIDEKDSGDDGSESYTDPRQSHRVPEEDDDEEEPEPARPFRVDAGKSVNDEESNDVELSDSDNELGPRQMPSSSPTPMEDGELGVRLKNYTAALDESDSESDSDPEPATMRPVQYSATSTGGSDSESESESEPEPDPPALIAAQEPSDDESEEEGSEEMPPPPGKPERSESIASVSLNDGVGLNDDFDYDDLGKKWGMSESEIAEDAAILTPRRKLSDEEQPPASTALAAALFGVEPDNSDEESINKWVTGPGQGDTGKSSRPVPKGWRLTEERATVEPSPALSHDNGYSDDGSIKIYPSNDKDEASYDDDSDDNDTYDESLKKVEKDGDDSSFSDDDGKNSSLNEDDFENMMGEAAAALAAAEELLPSGDDDTLEDNDDSYRKRSYGGVDSDDSPANKKVVGKPKRVENYEIDRSDMRKLSDHQLKGGKPMGYEPKRHVDKFGPSVKPAVMKEGKKSLLPEYDDYSVSVAPDSQSFLQTNNPVREQQPMAVPEREASKKESKKNVTSSRSRKDETKKASSRKETRSSSRKLTQSDDKDRVRGKSKTRGEEKDRTRSKSKARLSNNEEKDRTRSKSKARHAIDGETKSNRRFLGDEDEKKKKSKRDLGEDKKKKNRAGDDDDEKKKSKKKKSEKSDDDTAKRKKKSKKASS